MGIGCYSTSQRGWVRARWCLSHFLGNSNAASQLFLMSGDTSMLPFPFLSDSLDSSCGPYLFVCLLSTCLYTTLGMVSILQRPGSVILATVEPPIDDFLEIMTQGLEQGGDHQGILLLLTKEATQQGSEDEHEANVDQNQEHRQGRVDERATNENVDIPQPEAQNGNPHTQRHEQERHCRERSIGQLIE